MRVSLELGAMLGAGGLLFGYGFEFQAPVELFRGGRGGKAEGDGEDLFQSPVGGDRFGAAVEARVAAHETLVEGLDDAVRLDTAHVRLDCFQVAAFRFEALAFLRELLDEAAAQPLPHRYRPGRALLLGQERAPIKIEPSGLV